MAEQLKTPINVMVIDKKLVWDPVEGADSYSVYSLPEGGTIADGSWLGGYSEYTKDLSSLEDGTYRISVVAVGYDSRGLPINSEPSVPIDYVVDSRQDWIDYIKTFMPESYMRYSDFEDIIEVVAIGLYKSKYDIAHFTDNIDIYSLARELTLGGSYGAQEDKQVITLEFVDKYGDTYDLVLEKKPATDDVYGVYTDGNVTLSLDLNESFVLEDSSSTLYRQGMWSYVDGKVTLTYSNKDFLPYIFAVVGYEYDIAESVNYNIEAFNEYIQNLKNRGSISYISDHCNNNLKTALQYLYFNNVFSDDPDENERIYREELAKLNTDYTYSNYMQDGKIVPGEMRLEISYIPDYLYVVENQEIISRYMDLQSEPGDKEFVNDIIFYDIDKARPAGVTFRPLPTYPMGIIIYTPNEFEAGYQEIGYKVIWAVVTNLQALVEYPEHQSELTAGYGFNVDDKFFNKEGGNVPNPHGLGIIAYQAKEDIFAYQYQSIFTLDVGSKTDTTKEYSKLDGYSKIGGNKQ